MMSDKDAFKNQPSLVLECYKRDNHECAHRGYARFNRAECRIVAIVSEKAYNEFEDKFKYDIPDSYPDWYFGYTYEQIKAHNPHLSNFVDFIRDNNIKRYDKWIPYPFQGNWDDIEKNHKETGYIAIGAVCYNHGDIRICDCAYLYYPTDDIDKYLRWPMPGTTLADIQDEDMLIEIHQYQNEQDKKLEEARWRYKFQQEQYEKWGIYRTGNTSTNKKEHVYLIKCGDIYKIGRAVNPKARLKDIQIMNPYECVLVFSKQVSNAPTQERQLHKQYAHKRKHGEWFCLDDNDVKTIMAM